MADKKIKLLFFCFQGSIHARRRVQLFIDDDRFDVAVISNGNYEFKNAINVELKQSHDVFLPTFAQLRSVKELPWYFFLLIIFVKLFYNQYTSTFLLKNLSFISSFIKELNNLFIVCKTANYFNPDIIFLQTLIYPSYLAYILPKKIPFIVTFWNGDITWWAKWTGFEQKYKKWIVEYGVKRAKMITVNSQTAYQTCLETYNCPKEKIKLIQYPAVNLDLFIPTDKLASKEKIGISAKKVVFFPRGYVMGGYLNVEIFLDAISLITKQIPRVYFLFAGNGSDEDWNKIVAILQSKGISSENYARAKKIDWAEMPLYYNASDIMVSISSNDSLPNCMLEAMACGTPLLMGDIPQIREWVTHQTNGLLVSTNDAEALALRVLELLDNKNNFTEKFIQYNLKLIKEHFDSQKNINQIKNYLLEIIKTS